jgi:hypothetical protein
MKKIILKSQQKIVAKSDRYVLITYRNDRPIFGTYFYNAFNLRLEASFFHRRFKETIESSEFNSGTVVQLTNTMKEQQLLVIEPVPAFFMLLIKKIFMMNEIKVEDTDVVQEENLEISQLNNKYPNYLLQVWLTLKNSFKFNIP